MAEAKTTEEQKSFLLKLQEFPANTREYFRELKSEMKRVTWPNRKQVESTTVVVLFTVFAFAAYFWIVDGVLGRAIPSVQKAFTK